jgi:phytol kinase
MNLKSDGLALLCSYSYVFAVIFAAEGLRKWRNYSVDFTRKFIHIGVGMWVIGTVLLFENRFLAVIPPLSFVLINYISYRRETFKAMETGEKGNLGTVYFPFSFAVLILALWSRPDLLVASLMPMTWGDAAAALIGTRFGVHRYKIAGQSKSWEGSAAMLALSWLAVSIALGAFSSLGWPASIGYAFLVALWATGIEALTPYRLDNLTVPLGSGLLLFLLLA